MTLRSHPVARLRDALHTGDATIALAAAHETLRVALADAVAVYLLFAQQNPMLHTRAAARVRGRLCLKSRGCCG